MLYDCSGGFCNLFTAVMTGDSQTKSNEGVVLSHGYFDIADNLNIIQKL